MSLTNAKIVGPATNGEYMRQDVKRGDPAMVMSRSELKQFVTCPSRWLAGYKEGGSDEQSWGDLVDCIVLTPDDFEDRFIVAPATYPAKGKKKDDPEIQKPWNWAANYCKEWRENQAEGITVIKHDDSLAVYEARKALLGDDSIRELLQASRFQVLITADYVDRETGIAVPLKGLVDIAPSKLHPDFGKCLADLKTCNSAHPSSWAKQVNNFGYDTQAALYLDIWNAATGEKRNEFRHVLQENYAPWQVGKRILSKEFLDLGRQKYLSALHHYVQCLATGFWPDYEFGQLMIGGWSITDPEAWMVTTSFMTAHVPDPEWLAKPRERTALEINT